MKLIFLTLSTYLLAISVIQAVIGSESERDLVSSPSDMVHQGYQLHPRKNIWKRMIRNTAPQNNNVQKEEIDRAFEELAKLIMEPSNSRPFSPTLNRQPIMRPAFNPPGPFNFRRPLPPPSFFPGPLPHGPLPPKPHFGSSPPPPPNSSLAPPPPPKSLDTKKSDSEEKPNKEEDKEESEPEDKEEPEDKPKPEDKEEAEDKEESEESNEKRDKNTGAKKEKEEA